MDQLRKGFAGRLLWGAWGIRIEFLVVGVVVELGWGMGTRGR